MLQINQTENPMCSATIDQIRLRRAITLPLVSQKVRSSGFQSEIQLGSFELIFELSLFKQPDRVALPWAHSSLCAQCRDGPFGGRHQWRREELFKLRARAESREKRWL